MSIKEGSVGGFIDQLAERQATPAGGAVAALCAAQAAALIRMVALYSSKRRDTNNIIDIAVVPTLAAECDLLRGRSLELVEQDVVAFDAVAAAYSLSQETKKERLGRSAIIQVALVDATEPQAAIAKIGVRLVFLADQLLPFVNPNVIVDLAAAVEATRAALSIARLNVEANVSQIVDPRARTAFSSRLSGVNHAIDRAEAISADILRDKR